MTALGASLSLLAAPTAGLAAPGDLDPTFGSGGAVATVVPGDTELGPGGKVTIGWYQPPPDYYSDGWSGVARLNADGSPDSTFGGDDGVFLDESERTVVTDIALQADGGIIAAGGSGLTDIENGRRGEVRRFNPDGSRDRSFGSDGTAVLRAPEGEFVATTVILHPTGRILVAGRLEDTLTVWALDAAGRLDPSFGSGGRVDVPDVPTFAYGLGVQRDGRIIAAGGNPEKQTLVRLTPNGTLDSSFGQGGRTTRLKGNSAPGGSASDIASLVVQPDDRVIVFGEGTITRYTAAGALDTTFGAGGTTSLWLSRQQDGVQAGQSYIGSPSGGIASDGRILIAGTDPYTGTRASARLLPQGCLDQSYGGTGLVETSDPFYVRRAKVLPDGRLLVGGSGSVGEREATVLRLQGGGTAQCVPPPARPPRLDALEVSPRAFRPARRGGSIAPRGPATIRFTSATAATVRFKVTRTATETRLRGEFKYAASAGANSFGFTGRLRSRALRPGRYRLWARIEQPRGTVVAGKFATFRIRAPKR